MSDTPITLDDFEFQDFEVPERFPFGGAQKISTKHLIGGARRADAMGADNRPITWSGRIQGEDALDRALTLDAKRKAGKDLALSWGELAFTVKIEEFLPDAEKVFDIPFTITLLVVSDDTAPLSAGAGPTVDEVMTSDMASANDLGDRIGDSSLTGALGSLTAAVGSVQNFANASRSTLATVLAPIAMVQSRVSSLIGSSEAVLGSVSGLGGVVPGVSPLKAAASLQAQVAAMTRCADLNDLQNLI